ncbi:MAG: hypothetical protein HC781_03280 [Leptolyngbyaceae cyanobacterium CSU_1_4]|nr:hypothetical protein [Leptolyngbyaceae cyanobacterium CSU_1_4]
MRARIDNDVLFLHKDDVPSYKKTGSVVRNTYFWTLRSIAGHAPFDRDWEYESEVWLALQRVLISYGESGYLGLRETTLEFTPEPNFFIPEVFRSIATWADEDG